MAHALLARSARSGGLGVNLTPSSSYDLLNCCSLPLYLPLCVHLDLQERNHEAVLEIKGTEKLRKRARKYIKYVSVPPGCTPASLCGCRVGVTIFMGSAGGQKPAFEAPRSWSALGLHVGDSTADGSDP
jgi:hypothetical protein